jgi:uroporphyrinogen-III synthase
MVTKSSLDGLKVLVTRPEQQARSLCDSITSAGGFAIALPVLDIVPILPWNESTLSLAEQDMIIFISRNAATHFMTGLQTSLADNVQLVAVGAGTAATMRELGLRVDTQPPPPAGSESLLTMPELNTVQDKNVLIVRGDGGRELLADTLLARGANISYLEVYRRGLPYLSKQEIEQAKTADCIVITSIAGLNNLCRLIDIDQLTPKWLIVMSERIRQYALNLGFQQCVVATDASDAAVMQQVNRMERSDGKK